MPSRITTQLPSDMPAAIRQAKAHLREQIGDVAGTLAEVEEAMRTEVGAVVAEREAGHELFPIVPFADIAAGTVPEDTSRPFGAAVAPSSGATSRALVPNAGTPG